MIEVLFLAAQLGASTLTYEQAKAAADAYEASLEAPKKVALMEAQGKALGSAFAACGGKGRTPIAPFTIVAHVSQAGATDQTWRKGDTDLAQCVEIELSGARLPTGAAEPFYTSYELSFEP